MEKLPIHVTIMNEVSRWVDLQKIKKFTPKVKFKISYKNLEVKTLETPEELREVLRLRYEVFYREGMGRNTYGYDVDRYDLLGDHLVIRDTYTGRLIGTYRMLCSRFTNEFYSQSEFDISEVMKKCEGVFLELGRACIHKDFRNGMTLHLLWKGLARYVQVVGADYLFGCASVKTVKANETAQLLHSLEKMGALRDDYQVRPNFEYQMPGLELCYRSYTEHPDDKKLSLPPLILSYLAAGAYVHGRPAFDRAFQCIDLFTVLKIEDINPRYRSKYFDEWESLANSFVS